MTNGHLNDEMIQEYLDGHTPQANGEIRRHLDGCSACRKFFDSYRLLYSELEKAPAWEVGPGFADLVLQRLPERRRRFRYLWIILLGFFGLLAGAAALFYPQGTDIIRRMAESFLKPFSPLVTYLKPLAATVLERLDGSVPVIAAALLAFCILVIADRFIGRRLLHSPGVRR